MTDRPSAVLSWINKHPPRPNNNRLRRFMRPEVNGLYRHLTEGEGAVAMTSPARREEGKGSIYNCADQGPWGWDHRKWFRFSIALEQQWNPQSPTEAPKQVDYSHPASPWRRQGSRSGQWDAGQLERFWAKWSLGLCQPPDYPGPWKGVWGSGDESEGIFSSMKHKENLRVPSSLLPRTLEWCGGAPQREWTKGWPLA